MTMDGYIIWEVYQDLFIKRRFNAFIRQDLLLIIKPFPKACSVLIIDNYSIHHSEELSEMCMETGIILLYLPAYSPDMNPIE
jgi:transposase